MHPSIRILTALMVVCGVIGAVPARSVIVKKNLAELAQEADAIVVARVRGGSAGWDEAHRLIWTTTQLDVASVWKGKVKAGECVAVRELGGTVGDRTLRVAGMPRYWLGEQVLVFLRRDGGGTWRTLGLHQGRHRVVAGPTGEGAFVEVARGHVHVFEGQLESVPAADRKRPSLEQLRVRVEALIASAPVKKGGK